MKIKTAPFAITTVALVASLVGPAFAADLPATETCADLLGPGRLGSARLSCDCLPNAAGGPQSWWPLQEDAADYCGVKNGGIDDSTEAPKSFSPLGIRKSLDVSSGIFVKVDDPRSAHSNLDGMDSLSLAVVVQTTKGTQPLLSKRVAGTKDRDVQSYSFRLDNEYLYLDLYGEATGSKHESCISFKSNKKVKKAELKKARGALLTATWAGFNRAAFYVDRRPLGATHIRHCKETVAEVRASETPLWLGASARAGKKGAPPILAKEFDGQMRDAVLYRRALEPTEICQLADLLVPQDQPSSCAVPRSSRATVVTASSGQ